METTMVRKATQVKQKPDRKTVEDFMMEVDKLMKQPIPLYSDEIARRMPLKR